MKICLVATWLSDCKEGYDYYDRGVIMYCIIIQVKSRISSLLIIILITIIQVIHAKKGDLSSVEQFLEMGANVDGTC